VEGLVAVLDLAVMQLVHLLNFQHMVTDLVMLVASTQTQHMVEAVAALVVLHLVVLMHQVVQV
jgi:hypothetical protein